MKMYYEPNSRITVGNVLFENVNRVEITQNVKTLGDKAIVVLPRNFKKVANKGILEYIKVGDKVTIELGYDGQYWTEFEGYLGEIESGEPLILHVDDAFYPLKRNNYVKAWEKVSLREVLEYVAPGYTIECPDVNLGAFDIPNVSTYRVIRALMQQYGFYTRIYDTTTIRCLWAYDFNRDIIHTYQFYNNIKKNNLKYHRQEDVQIRVKGIANQRNGKKLRYETGSDASTANVRSLNYGPISLEDLKTNVENDYKRFAFDGYGGSITGFAYPRTYAGDTLKIIDALEPDREGNYLIEKTIIRYDMSTGYERENTLSFKV